MKNNCHSNESGKLNNNQAFQPDPNKPFWEQNLNPITMFPVIPMYVVNSNENGLPEMKINKRTNHFVKNFT